jgi:hypothetical protein
MNKLVYIVGPYAAYGGHPESRNVARAAALGALALATERVPIIPHLTIGCPSLLLSRHGRFDADLIARRASCGDGGGGLAGAIRDSWATIDIDCWCILRDDGARSPGTAAEISAILQDPLHAGAVERTWAQWRPAFEEAGLSSLHEGTDRWLGFERWPGDLVARPAGS